MLNIKRLVSSLLLLSFLFVDQAKADIDVQNMVATTLASAGNLGVVMGLATGTAVAVSGGLALGALGVAIYLANDASPTSNASNTPITINLNPKIPLITPSGWTSGTSSSVQPVAPNTTAFVDFTQNVQPTTAQAYYSAINNMSVYGTTPQNQCTNYLGKVIPTFTQPITSAVYKQLNKLYYSMAKYY